MPKPDIPHLRVPLRFKGNNPNLDLVEQDTEVEIAQCVEAILRHHIGHRPEAPEFGIPELAFTQQDPTADQNQRAVLNAVETWEPRADVTIVPQLDVTDQSLRLRVEVKARTSG